MARWTGTEQVMLGAMALVGIGTVFLLAHWVASGAAGAPPSAGGFAIITGVGGNFAVHRARREGRGLRPVEIVLLVVLAGATIVVGAVGIAVGGLGEKVFSAVFIVLVIASIIGICLQLKRPWQPGPDDPPAHGR